LPAHPQGFGEDGVRVTDFRQAVVEDNISKLLSGYSESLVQSPWRTLTPRLRHSAMAFWSISMPCPDVPFFRQDTQKFSLAAAQVQHRGSVLYYVQYYLVSALIFSII